MTFQILLTTKIKNNPINQLFDIIEAIQSYDYDWRFYLVDTTEKGDFRAIEKITPIPTNVGALDFTGYIFNDEEFLERSKKYVRGRRWRVLREVLKVGYPIEKVIGEDLFEKIISENKDLILEVSLEVFFVLKPEVTKDDFKEVEDSLDRELFKDFSYELVETNYYYLPPERVLEVLDRSTYLIDYLENLVRLYENTDLEDRGLILIVRGKYPANKTMLNLETELDKFMESIKDLVAYRTLLFNRII